MKRLLLAGGVAVTNLIWQVEAALAAADPEKQPIDLPLEQAQREAAGGGSSSSGSLGRTLIGLIVVVAIIYGLYWVLKQVKRAREEQASGSGLHSLASLPLGPNRSLHMVRAGREIVLVGVAEHGVAPIRAYTEEEAHEAGLIDLDDDDDGGGSGSGGSGAGGAPDGQRGGGFASPGQALSHALQGLRDRTVRR
jgi:flagellar protein FliO/FliZ